MVAMQYGIGYYADHPTPVFWRGHMLIDVEITHTASDRYIARVLLWPDVVVEASSRSEALEQVSTAIRERRSSGVEIVQLVLDDSPEAVRTIPWRKHAGSFPSDELYEQMLNEIQ